MLRIGIYYFGGVGKYFYYYYYFQRVLPLVTNKLFDLYSYIDPLGTLVVPFGGSNFVVKFPGVLKYFRWPY